MKSKHRHEYALKEIIQSKFKREGRMKEIFIEKTVLEDLDHPGIVKFYQSFMEKKSQYLYFVLEHCSGGSLSDFLMKQKHLSVPLARHFTAEIILVLEYLRKKEIVHRDLKPGNVVLDD